MRMCQELAELGMQLARAIAAKALQDLAPPEPAQPEPAQPQKPAADPALAFARITRAVRQCIALEAHLMAGSPQGRPKPQRPPPDPRRATLQNIFETVLRTNPNRAELKRETNERLETQLATDPDGNISIPDIFYTIVNDLGIELDLANIPDETLDQLIPENFVPEDGPEDVHENDDDLEEAEDLENPEETFEPLAPLTPPAAEPLTPALHPFLASHTFAPGSTFDRCTDRPPWSVR
jgi:hypothetical protein